ncbi:DHH family phosphoesterase [Salinibaculum rarum]|uniref:DHH family phosphoesterase n=1 Tax=Salinibaculum rarum TaxID=3058903 RepID=UPI00265EF84F|nr:DHHA1 domain-containing protein [Salinibaculum sp. KK48]
MPSLSTLRHTIDGLWTIINTAKPAVLAGTILVCVFFGGGIVYAIKRWRRTPSKQFQKALATFDEVTILTHPTPDPDAMAAAMAVQHLATYTNTDTTIQYPGEIRHQENRAFRTVLDLSAEQIESVADLSSDNVILVDHNSPRGFQGANAVEPVAIIDHHPGDGTEDAFTDIRTDYGATASILTEYFHALDFEPITQPQETVGDDKILPREVTTGLMHGILTDTGNFTRGCTDAEFNLSKYLYSGIDADLLDRVVNPPISAETLEIVSQAVTDRDVDGPYAISDVGTVSNIDALSQAADKLLQLEGISAVIVMGDNDETLHLSARSRDDRIHMGNVIENVLEDIPQSGGGGHARMGGGQVSLPHLEGLVVDSGMERSELTHELFDELKTGG